MKKQEINLCRSLPGAGRNFFTEAIVSQFAAIFLVLLVLITLFQFMVLSFDKYQTRLLQKKYIELNSRFVKEQKDNVGVDLIQLQQELTEKKKLLDLLNMKSEDGDVCPLMSDYFKSLSSAQVPGVWLTRIKIEPATRNMIFEGETHDPVLIMELVRKMGVTPCFSGIKFHSINVEKSSGENSKTMIFTITSVKTPLKSSGVM